MSSSGRVSPEPGVRLDKGRIAGEVPQLGFYLSRGADREHRRKRHDGYGASAGEQPRDGHKRAEP